MRKPAQLGSRNSGAGRCEDGEPARASASPSASHVLSRPVTPARRRCRRPRRFSIMPATITRPADRDLPPPTKAELERGRKQTLVIINGWPQEEKPTSNPFTPKGGGKVGERLSQLPLRACARSVAKLN